MMGAPSENGDLERVEWPAGLRPRAVDWDRGSVLVVDQRELPHSSQLLRIHTVDGMIEALRSLAIRGAPAIGVAGGFGMALAAWSHRDAKANVVADIYSDGSRLSSARPTAATLKWGVNRVRSVVHTGVEAALREAITVRMETEAAADLAARAAAEAVVDNCGNERLRVLTHCNTGWLTMGAGTGLGAIKVLAEEDRLAEVLVSETRPLLQGARLTAWELGEAGIPYRLCTDNAAPAALSAGMIDCVIVGADRIAQNGDVANKIGTYSLALSAAAHNVPFIVVATEATLDRSLAHGDDIEIEQRHASEVTHIGGVAVAPSDARVYNPAFDITPSHLTTAVITEMGVFTGHDLLRKPLQGSNVSSQQGLAA